MVLFSRRDSAGFYEQFFADQIIHEFFGAAGFFDELLGRSLRGFFFRSAFAADDFLVLDVESHHETFFVVGPARFDAAVNGRPQRDALAEFLETTLEILAQKFRGRFLPEAGVRNPLELRQHHSTAAATASKVSAKRASRLRPPERSSPRPNLTHSPSLSRIAAFASEDSETSCERNFDRSPSSVLGLSFISVSVTQRSITESPRNSSRSLWEESPNS